MMLIRQDIPQDIGGARSRGATKIRLLGWPTIFKRFIQQIYISKENIIFISANYINILSKHIPFLMYITKKSSIIESTLIFLAISQKI